jgi:YegS/Rv2252/BmrU family lipid kinase
MKHYFIINPNAGNGKRAGEIKESVKECCASLSVEFEIYMTKGVGDGTAFVKSICENADNLPARFYACGGDGTLGEVANGVLGVSGAEVGLIPIGTGNDYARNFSHGELFFDIEAQINGEAVSVDLLRCNDMCAVNMINIGFDCEVVKKKEYLQTKPYLPSKLAYIFGLVICLAKKPGMRARITCDGEELGEKKLLLTTYANGRYCGGGFLSNPISDITDGKIDALFIDDISRMKFVSLVGSYKKGTHINEKNAKILKNKKCSKIILEFPSVQSASVDGEIFDFERLEIECLSSAMSFVLPRGVERETLAGEALGAEV